MCIEPLLLLVDKLKSTSQLPLCMGKLPFEEGIREIIVKREALTVKEHGVEPLKRSIPDLLQYGIVNIDKPAGPSSHQVSAYVQQILKIPKSGHSGTLDPNVTGVLVMAIGKATRVVQTLLTAGKEYVCVMHLHEDISEYDVYRACNEFLGTINQLPPIKSAVKRQWRERSIYYLEILEVRGRDVLFIVGCQAGTYIRKLVHDIGQKIGCGAHMSELRRTKAGPFNEETLVTLQELSDAFHYYTSEKNEVFLRKIVQPMEAAVSHLPKVWALDSSIHSLTHGANLCVPGFSKVHTDIEKDDVIAVMSLKEELIAMGVATMTTEQMMKKEKGVCVRIDKVFMDTEMYPKVLG